MKSELEKKDSQVFSILQKEEERQQDVLSMIPSENFFSPALREAVGSVVMHKYSEGNIGQRYYEGNQNIDDLESLAIERAHKLFDLPEDWSVNVQALSGSNANLSVYLAIMEMGDTMMGMYLPDGGHLSHGWSYEKGEKVNPNDLVYLGGSRKVQITSRIFKTVQYKTRPEDQLFDYGEVEKIAKEHKPKLLVAGGTAYPRLFDHEKMRDIAHGVGAMYLADIAHEAGLVAAKVIPSPVGIADVVTMTTHKTLRSGRGSIILARDELMKKINRAVLPGLQGGPHNHNIAGICLGLGEALTEEYREYAKQEITNTKILADELIKHGFNLVSGGADKHLILVNLTKQPILGRKFAYALGIAGIVTNFNTMPQETRSPADPSALRLGTPWITTRGMKEKEMIVIASWIKKVMDISSKWSEMEFEEFKDEVNKNEELRSIAQEVKGLCGKFPLEIKVGEEEAVVREKV
jgi:glycine hydroxymethyltransferase